MVVSNLKFRCLCFSNRSIHMVANHRGVVNFTFTSVIVSVFSYSWLYLHLLHLQASGHTCLSSVSIGSYFSHRLDAGNFFPFIFFIDSLPKDIFSQVCFCQGNRDKIPCRWSAVAHLLGVILVPYFIWAYICENNRMVNNCSFILDKGAVFNICRLRMA